MYLGAVQPGELTVAEIRERYPVAIDAPPMLKPAVEPDRVWINGGGAVRTAEVVRDPYTGDWKHPSDVYPVAPAYTATTTVSIPKSTAATWMWVAAGVGLLGIFWMMANAK